MTPCDNMSHFLGPWLDGELDAAAREQVRAHLAACAACAGVCSEWKRMQDALKEMLGREAETVDFPIFWRKVQDRIAGHRPWHEAFYERCHGLLAAPRAAWAVPALIVLLLSLVSVESFWPGWRLTSPRSGFAVIDSIDAHGRNFVLWREHETKTTVIWLYDDQEGEHEAAEEAPSSGPTF